MISDRAIRSAVEQFRLEVPSTNDVANPDFQVILDASLSMTSGDGSKDQRARELTILLLRLSQQAGLAGRAYVLRGGGRNRVLEHADASRVLHLPFDGVQALEESWDDELLAVRPDSFRVMVSDFLFAGDPGPLVRRAGASVGKLWLVQLLDDWELRPTPAGPTRFVDIETDEVAEIVVDQAAIDAYSSRLNRLLENLAKACQLVGASLVTACASVALEAMCRDSLVPAGLLRPRNNDEGRNPNV